MREKNVEIEFTPTEVMINAKALYLASLLLKNPELVKGDTKAEECILSLLMDKKAWKGYIMKMMRVCITAQSTEYL